MSKNSNSHAFLNTIMQLIDLRIQYQELKQNPETKKVSQSLGLKSIGFAVAFILTFGFGILLFKWANGMMDSIAIFVAVFVIIIAIATLIYSLSFFILALSGCIKQLKLNLRPTGWIALVLVLASIVYAIVAIATIIG